MTIEDDTTTIASLGVAVAGKGYADKIELTEAASSKWTDVIQHELDKISNEVSGKIGEKVVTPWTAPVPQVTGANELVQVMRNTSAEEFKLDADKYGAYLQAFLATLGAVHKKQLEQAGQLPAS